MVLSPVVMVKDEILDIVCTTTRFFLAMPYTHESLNADIKRVWRAFLPPLERHIEKMTNEKKAAQHER